MINTIEELQAHELAAKETIVLRKIYVDITNDLIAGLLLSQLFYWYLPGQDGTTRAKVIKDGKRWIAKTREDWWSEVRISAKQFDRAKKILMDIGLIKTKTYKFNGNPTVHIWLNQEKLLELYNDEIGKSLLPKGEEPNLPKGNNDIDQKGISLTDTTTDTTTEKKPLNPLSEKVNSIFVEYRDEWNKLFPDKPKLSEENKGVKESIGKALKRYGKPIEDNWKQALHNASRSPHLQHESWFHSGWLWLQNKNGANYEKCLNFYFDSQDQQNYGYKGSDKAKQAGSEIDVDSMTEQEREEYEAWRQDIIRQREERKK